MSTLPTDPDELTAEELVAPFQQTLDHAGSTSAAAQRMNSTGRRSS